MKEPKLPKGTKGEFNAHSYQSHKRTSVGASKVLFTSASHAPQAIKVWRLSSTHLSKRIKGLGWKSEGNLYHPQIFIGNP